MTKGKPLPSARVRTAAPQTQPQGVSVRFLGYANHATWEEHMEWSTRGLPEAEKEAIYAKYGAIRAEAEAKDVTLSRG
jgi:hypothetical protein